MKLRQLLFNFFLSKLTAAATCGSATIASQADADALKSACPAVTGNVILATNAAGDINFDGIQVINGDFAAELCSQSCSSLASLSSSTLVSVSQNISLQRLPDLTSVSFPGLQTVGGSFYLDSLPNLQNISIYNLSSVGQFHLASTPSLVSMELKQLQNVTGQNPAIEIIGVGLSVLQSLNVDTPLSSFTLRDSPKVFALTLTTPKIDNIDINLNESTTYHEGFTFSTSLDANARQSIGTLNMSGCSSFAAVSPTVFENLILSQNTFSYLDLTPVKITNNLSIADNPLLSQALLPTDMSMQNIEIRGNDELQDQEIVAGTESWPWGMKNVSSMILEGQFEPDFFRLFNNLTLVEVSKNFSLQSTNETFDCTFLNSLRKQGYFQGNYTCQGKTVAAGHVRTTAGSAGSRVSASSTALVARLIFGVVCFFL